MAFALLIAAPWIVGLPGIMAQEDDAPLSLVAIDGHDETRPSASAELVWDLVSSDPARSYVVVVEAAGPAGSNWELDATPAETTLEPGGSVTLRLVATADARPTPRLIDVELRVVAINGTDALYRLQADGSAEAIGTDLILGTWENPLDPPLDNMWGAFLLNAGAWFLISGAVMLAINPTLKAVTLRTKTDVDDHIIAILRKPVFLVLFTFGIKQSLEVFPLPVWAFHLLDRLYTFVLVAAIVYVSYRVWQEIVLIIGRRVAKRTESELDDRLLPVFEKVGGIIILVVGVFYIINSLGVDLTLFAAGGVLVSMVIAFAAQDTLSNFFSGIHLLVDQPFKEGDDIILDSGEITTVAHIGLRSTHLYHRANHETIMVPNNLLATNRIINLLQPDDRYKVRVDIGVAYGTDVQLVKRILLDIATNHPDSLTDDEHEPFVRFQNFGASSLDFSLHLWIADVYSRWRIASEIREAIDQRFAEHGIEIPFPQRVIWNGREEADRAAANPPKPATILEGKGVKRAAGDRTGRAAESTAETGAEPGGSGDGGDDGGESG